MRPKGILHPELVDILVRTGHGDILVLADAGLKVPPAAQRVDLGLRCGIPTIVQTLEAVLGELVVERAIVAAEFREWNPDVAEAIRGMLRVEPEEIPHAEFSRRMAEQAYAYVKTGECSAYASVALVCGVSYLEEAIALKATLDRKRA